MNRTKSKESRQLETPGTKKMISLKQKPFTFPIGMFLGLIILTMGVYGEAPGFKYFKNYSFLDYEHQPQNWEIAQAKNGLIYVANNGGVLEFDGVSWRVIQVPGYDMVRSLAVDKASTVYVGGRNKIGYLTPDSNGTLKYVSLLTHLNENQQNFSSVWRTHAVKDSIYFRSSKFLFRWQHRGAYPIRYYSKKGALPGFPNTGTGSVGK
ncbi:MAG: hypothetical protein GY757_40370 [bacterium]|nr:hypothetical protein [bacterium]